MRESITLIIVFIFLTLGCSRTTGGNENFNRVEGLIDAERYDEALGLVDSLRMTPMDEKDRIYGLLLEIKVRDRMSEEPMDSTMLSQIADFYIERDLDPENKGWAYYYLGRNALKHMDRQVALEYLRKAMENVESKPEDKDNLDLKSCIHAQIATLYLESGLYRNAIFHFKKEIGLDLLLKEYDWTVINYLHLSNLYRWLSENDSSKLMFERAEQTLPLTTSPKTRNILQTQKIVLLMKEGDFTAADSIISQYSLSQDSLLGLSGMQVIANLEWEKGNLQSVKEKSLKLLEIGDIYRKRKAAEYLSRIYMEEKNVEESMRYLKMYKKFSDSLINVEAATSLPMIDTIYDKRAVVADNNALIKDHDRQTVIITLLIVILVSAITVGVPFLLKWRKKLRHNHLLKVSEIKEEMETLSTMHRNESARLKEELHSLNNQFLILQQENLQLSNAEEKYRLQLKQSQNDYARLKDENSNLMSDNQLKDIRLDQQATEIEDKEKRIKELERFQTIIENKESQFNLSEAINIFLDKVHNGPVKDKDFLQLQSAIELAYPRLMPELKRLKLNQRERFDALTIAIGLQQKLAASLFQIKPAALSNARARLYRKYFPDATSSNWVDYIRSLCK